jgi:hypothetical protein
MLRLFRLPWEMIELICDPQPIQHTASKAFARETASALQTQPIRHG